MSRPPQKNPVLLDWIAVSYRTVAWIAAGLVLLAAGGAYFVFFAEDGARAEAAAALARATGKIQEIPAPHEDTQVDDLRAAAAAAIAEGRLHFGDERFEDALRAARHAENLAHQALDRVHGDGASAQASVYRIEGDVRIKRAGEFSWEPASVKMTLGLGDQVKTAASASAQILYFDGTVTTIRPASLLEIRLLSEDRVTKVKRIGEKLNWGEVLASSQKRNAAGSYHEVATDTVTARVTEPGEVRVAFDKDNRTAALDVFQGRVEVAGAGRKESLEAGERIRSAADGTLSAKEQLPVAPRLVAPSDQRVFVYEDPGAETTTLRWERVPDASSYHLLITDRLLFTEPLYDDAGRKDTAVVIEGISPADYYWKVAAINGKGAQGPWSAVRRFRVTTRRIRDASDTTPPPLQIDEFVQTGSVVIINGRTEPGALLWVENEKIEVHEDGTFYAVVKLRKEGENVLQFLAQDASGNAEQATRSAFVEAF